MLHGFNLVTSSVFGSADATEVIKRANRLATGTKATQLMNHHVKTLAQLNNISVGLHPAGLTRFSSQWECLNSVNAHYGVFQQLISDPVKAASIPKPTASQEGLSAIINDISFWSLLRPLKDLMLPFQQVKHVSFGSLCFALHSALHLLSMALQ